jgi:hypothetical protein
MGSILDWFNQTFGNPTYSDNSNETSKSSLNHNVLGTCSFVTEESPGLNTNDARNSFWVSVPKGWGFEIMMAGSPESLNKNSELQAIEIYKRLTNIEKQAKLINPSACDLYGVDCRDLGPKVIFSNPEDDAYANPPIYIAELDLEYNVIEVVKDWN